MANGLIGVDLVRCWVAWRIMPLSRRPGLMCEYTGDVKDPQRHNHKELNDDHVSAERELGRLQQKRVESFLRPQQAASCKLLNNFRFNHFFT